MSTYTDLHHRIKDNITVLRRPGHPDDGMTPQLVKLMNPENEYYGTFKGNVDIKRGILQNVEIDNAFLHNVELCNAYMNGQNLDNIAQNLIDISVGFGAMQEYLSDVVESNASCHHKIFTALCGEISNSNININSISSILSSLSTNLSHEISNSVCHLDAKINSLSLDVCQLSNSLKSDIDSSYASASLSIEKAISIHNEDISLIYDDIAHHNLWSTTSFNSLKDKIDSSIDDEANQRKTDDQAVLNKAMEYSDANRHYSFVHHPLYVENYELKDFAINQIKVSAPLATVINRDGQIAVGKIIDYAIDDIENAYDIPNKITKIKIEFFDDIQGNIQSVVSKGHHTYELTRNQPIVNIGSNYVLEWLNPDNCESVENVEIQFRSSNDQITYAICKAKPTGDKVDVGFAQDVKTDAFGNISSCILNFNNGDRFDVESSPSYDKLTETKIEIDGRQLSVFTQYKQLSSQILVNELDGVENEFGFIRPNGIYQLDGKIVSVDACINLNGNTINATITPEKRDIVDQLGDAKYAAMLDQDNRQICIYEKRRIYVYQNMKYDPSYEPFATLSVGSPSHGEYNREIHEQFNNLYVSLRLQDVPPIIELQNTGHEFTYESDENGLNIRYHLCKLMVKRAQNTVFYTIDSQPYREECFDKLVAVSKPLTDEFNHIDETYGKCDVFEISDTENPYNVVEHLGIVQFNDSSIHVMMPPKIKNKSRECILTINMPHSLAESVRLDLGSSIEQFEKYSFEYFGKRISKIFVLTGRTTTIKFQEIQTNTFVIQDVDDSFLDNRVNCLEHRLNEVYNSTKALSDDVLLRATELDNELSNNLSERILALSDNVSAELSIIQQDLYDAIGELSQKNSLKGAVWIFDAEQTTPVGVFQKTEHLSTLFKTCDGIDDETMLSNGWMFVVKESSANTSHRFMIDGIELENNDYIIVKSASASNIPVKEITSADVYVIDAIDEYAKFESLSVKSCNDIWLESENASLSNIISAINDSISKNEDDFKSTLAPIDKMRQECGNISSNNLIITDAEHPYDNEKHQQYYMTFEKGTLVLKPLN